MGSRYEANQAELEFLASLSSGRSLKKEAADLDPETEDLLGIKNVSPSILDQLEAQAATVVPDQGPEPEPAPVQEEPTPEPPPGDDGALSGVDEPPVTEPEPEPELPERTVFGRLFSDRRAHPIQILEVLTNRYGSDWVDWEPETLWWALRRDYGPVGEIARNKIGALRLAATSDMPWIDWDVFEDSGLSWNDLIPIIGQYQPMSPMQAAFAVDVLQSIRPDEEFAHEVRVYIAAILEESGWAYAPEEWFPGVQAILDRRAWLMPFKTDVEAGWAKVKDVPPEEIDYRDDNESDIHLLKLAVVKRYLEEREILRNQAPGAVTGTSTVSPPVP